MGKEIISHCRMTVSEEVKYKDVTQFEPMVVAITGAGFKIISVSPLVIEKDSTSKDDLIRLADLLTSLGETQECSATTTTTPAGNKISDNIREKKEGASGSTTEGRSSAVKVNTPASEVKVEDYVMKKHQFHLAGEYFKDRDWKELFGKAQEIDEGFRFRGVDVSTDECPLLEILKKIAFETIGIPDGEAHRVEEAAEDMNCVDHGVCVIDYDSRPYLVGPKAQVNAAKEEIISQLEHDGIHCTWTVTTTLSMKDDSKDKNHSHDTVYTSPDAEKVKNITYSSDEEDDSIVEYVMKKTSLRLAKEYFSGRPEHQYFEEAEEIEEGLLFSLSSKSTADIRFAKSLRRLKFEKVGHREEDKAKVNLTAEQLKCKDLGVRVIEDGSKSFLVGPKEKVAEVKQKIILKLQKNKEASNSLHSPENSVNQRRQPGMKEYYVDSSSRSRDLGARPKRFVGMKSSFDKNPINSRCASAATSRSPFQGQVPGGGSKVDQSLMCGICTFAKKSVQPTSCCGILLCKDCADRVSACPYCHKQWRISTGNQPDGKGQVPGSGSKVDQSLVCGICTFAKDSVQPTSCCRILLCKDCADKVSACPYCRKQWRIRTGNQPRGYMIVSFTKESADGFDSKGSWKIEYFFPSGTQGSQHPNPGQGYQGTTRTAYIPAVEDSMNLLKLLRLAFIRRLTFTIGKSRTTGQDNRIVWNGISHKTSLHGGAYGFPDPNYFNHVCQELRVQGVTLESMTEAETPSIARFEKCLNSVKFFSDY